MGARGGSSHGRGGGTGGQFTSESYRVAEDIAQRLNVKLDIDAFIANNVQPTMVTWALKKIIEMSHLVPIISQIVQSMGVDDRKNVYASMSYYGDLYLGLVGKKKLDELTAMYERDVAANFHPKGTTARSIIFHELGHALEGYLAGFEHGLSTRTWGVVSDRIVLRAAQRYFDTVVAPKYREQELGENYIAQLRPAVIQDAHPYAQRLSDYAVSKIPDNFRHKTKATWATWETLAEGIGEYAERRDNASLFSRYIWEETMKEVASK